MWKSCSPVHSSDEERKLRNGKCLLNWKSAAELKLKGLAKMSFIPTSPHGEGETKRGNRLDIVNFPIRRYEFYVLV